MTEPVFREYAPSDIPGLTSLWTDVFGDSPTVVSAFFNELPDIGTCFAAGSDGEMIGMASVLTDQCYVNADTRVNIAYIYAVAVDPRFRGKGIGAKLSRLAEDYALVRGAQIISTLPAEEGLYSMYARTLGLESTLLRKKVTVSSDGASHSFPLSPADPEEYNRKREELLSPVPHISVSDGSIAFLKVLCRENGGGIYISDNCCASCYVNQNELFFSELLCPAEDTEKLLAGGAACHNAAAACCLLPSLSGEKSLAYKGRELPCSTVWNITFE